MDMVKQNGTSFLFNLDHAVYTFFEFLALYETDSAFEHETSIKILTHLVKHILRIFFIVILQTKTHS
jgi:hypothetical protein